jgi:hypothetical protein
VRSARQERGYADPRVAVGADEAPRRLRVDDRGDVGHLHDDRGRYPAERPIVLAEPVPGEHDRGLGAGDGHGVALPAQRPAVPGERPLLGRTDVELHGRVGPQGRDGRFELGGELLRRDHEDHTMAPSVPPDALR